MTFGELKSDVRTRLNEATSVFYSDADIAAAVQEGYADIADQTEFFERFANIETLAGHTYYDLTSNLPDTFLSPRRIYNGTTSKWLTPTDPRHLDKHTYRQWELVYGPPEKYLMRGNWWLGVFPRTSNDVPILRFYYTAIPAAFINDSDAPAFPPEFHAGIAEYAMSDLMSQQRETVKALGYWSSYQRIAGQLADFTEGRTKLAGFSVI